MSLPDVPPPLIDARRLQLSHLADSGGLGAGAPLQGKMHEEV